MKVSGNTRIEATMELVRAISIMLIATSGIVAQRNSGQQPLPLVLRESQYVLPGCQLLRFRRRKGTFVTNGP